MSKERGAFSGSEFFAGIAVSSLIFLAASIIPLVGTFFFILTPLPILYYYSKTGRIPGLTIFLISLFVVSVILIFSGSIINLPFLILSGCLGVIISEMFRKNYTIERTIFYPATFLVIVLFSFILFESLSLRMQPWHLIEDYIGRNIQASMSIYAQLDIPAEQIDLIKDNFKEITHFFTNIFPALILVSALFTVWINALAAGEIFPRKGMPYPDFGDLSRWKTPESLIWILIASGGMVLIPAEWAKFLGLNLLIICLFVYLLQGLSIISFLFKTKNINRVFRIACYFFIFVQLFFISLVIAVGAFDLWVDFRRFIKPITDSPT